MRDRTRVASQQKAEGAHYTPSDLAEFVAGQIVAEAPLKSRRKVRVLDPAVGDGSLLVALIQALRTANVSRIEVEGFDTSPDAVKRAAAALPSAQGVSVALHVRDFLDAIAPLITGQDALFGEESNAVAQYDMVIANPPYVRTQVMGAERAQRLAQTFELTGRVDLYYAFVRGIARVLKPEGVAGVIVSNRFMTTQSGASLRECILREFDIVSIYDFGDTRLFEAAVLPAVLVLKPRSAKRATKPAGYVSIYSLRGEDAHLSATDAFDAIQVPGQYRLPSGESFEVKHGSLNSGETAGATWRLANEETDAWLARVAAHTAMTFGDIGPIRVGIKTTADNVFVRSDWHELSQDDRPELLRPIITHHGATRFRTERGQSARQVLYTHTLLNGRRVAVDLAAYPKAARYLELHRKQLEGRKYVREAGRAWYEIWVPQNPEVWRLPKLVFRDISDEPMFWIDREGAVVNGDCYWLAVEDDRIDLLYLAVAVGNSSFIAAFYDHRFNNKLYAGRRRFITQYVQDFPLPNPGGELAQRMIALSKRLCGTPVPENASRVADELDSLTWRAFGLPRKE